MKMYLIVITALIQNLLIKVVNPQQILLDFMPINDEEEEEVNDQEFKLYVEVLEDPHFEYKLCSNDYQHEKVIQEYAMDYLVEKALEFFRNEKIEEFEVFELKNILEKFVEPTSSYISESEMDFRRIKFYDINVCNNVTENELEKILSKYYYKEDKLMYDLKNSHS